MSGKQGQSKLSGAVLGGAGLIGGLWMVVAPFVLNYEGITVLDAKSKKPVSAELGAVTTSDIIVGIVLIGLVGLTILTANKASLAKLRLMASVAVVGVGVYLMVAPYLFDLLKVAEYLSINKPNTNDVLIGLLTIILGGIALQREFSAVESNPQITSQVATTA
ncbi:MAG TPA: hypothetical protein VH186_33330 [Chloroflexia bacterium]|nr:hypothetical protein [Chloroflexia bacterium]